MNLQRKGKPSASACARGETRIVDKALARLGGSRPVLVESLFLRGLATVGRTDLMVAGFGLATV
jgi:hypothetical protein